MLNKLGRKTTMLLLVLPFTVGWLLVIFALNFSMMLIGRFLIGLAGGAFCIAAPQYTAEIAEREIRGTLGSFFQLLVVSGLVFIYSVGAFVDIFTLSVIGGIIPLIFGATFYFMPESPTYLISKGKDEEAIQAFKWLRGQKYDPSVEIEELKAELLEKTQRNLSVLETLTLPANKKALVIGFGLMFFQQISAINVVVFYATDIFEVNFRYQSKEF